MENKKTYLFEELPASIQEKALKRMFVSPYYEGMVENGVDDACQELMETLCPNSGYLIDWDFDFLGQCGEPPNRVVVKEFSLLADSPERISDLLKDVFLGDYLGTPPNNIFEEVILFCSFDDLAKVNIDSNANYNLVVAASETVRKWFSGVYAKLREKIKTTIASYHNLDYVREHVIGAGIEFTADGYDIGGWIEYC